MLQFAVRRFGPVTPVGLNSVFTVPAVQCNPISKLHSAWPMFAIGCTLQLRAAASPRVVYALVPGSSVASAASSWSFMRLLLPSG